MVGAAVQAQLRKHQAASLLLQPRLLTPARASAVSRANHLSAAAGPATGSAKAYSNASATSHRKAGPSLVLPSTSRLCGKGGEKG